MSAHLLEQVLKIKTILISKLYNLLIISLYIIG